MFAVKVYQGKEQSQRVSVKMPFYCRLFLILQQQSSKINIIKSISDKAQVKGCEMERVSFKLSSKDLFPKSQQAFPAATTQQQVKMISPIFY